MTHIFTLREVLAATGGDFVASLPNAENIRDSFAFVSVSTDTRTVKTGDLFVAIHGERYDGHMFLTDAYTRGATAAVVSKREAVPEGCVAIIVPDTQKALHDLARAYRRKLDCKVIAVTGSVGKTSTREMLASVFSEAFRTHSTKQNLNNEIGLPLTILSAAPDTELLILEMGMRMKGEIKTLTEVAEPDIAVITNIGVSHIERLGSREAIRDAKLEICEGLRDGGVLLVPGKDIYLSQYLRENSTSFHKKVGMTFTEKEEDPRTAEYAVRLESLTVSNTETAFSLAWRETRIEEYRPIGRYRVPAVGAHHMQNALLAVLAAKILGVSSDAISRGLLRFSATGSRGRILEAGPYLLIDDAYNASPESMSAAFETLRILTDGTGRRRIAAIGGVLELGTYANALHETIGRSAARNAVDCLYVCGDDRDSVAVGARSENPGMSVYLYPTREELTKALLGDLRPGDAVLAKGSHAFSMEKVIEAILHDIDGSEPSEETR